MKVIIGLGNPGIKYANNRHNVGHMVVDAMKVRALKTDCFMNDSGSFVAEKLKAYSIKPEALYVIHDDLDIKLGEYKIQFGKGPKVHNGLNDIYEKIGTSEFWHVRVGVDSRYPENRTKGDEYVLQDFTEEEKIVLNRVIKQICKKLVAL